MNDVVEAAGIEAAGIESSGIESAQTGAGANSMLAFDVERVRADFPILEQTVYGQPLVFLDSAASAQNVAKD